MIILDANLLLYAVNKDAFQHSKAKVWLEGILSGTEVVGFSWNVILAVLRLTTRPGVFRHPLRIERAFELVTEWLDQPAAQVVHPGTRHLTILRGLLAPLGTGGNLTSDAHLAALAIEQNAELCSCDSDFGRFAGLDWRNPLV
ncbi:MAG: type II toxin-antitoxin system VapC family toxin [Acidobacteriia bacterium]|nr:type II toxin-antitoxin system VapC family toxin [Terriglobia bacterium]